MRLKLIRETFTKNSTIGSLYVDGVFQCYILEDAVREKGVKIHGKTAIPYGTYEIVNTFSNRFQMVLPLLLNVPNYLGVRFHSGNYASNTEGCLLTGTTCKVDAVYGSRIAFKALFSKISKALKKEKVHIEITK